MHQGWPPEPPQGGIPRPPGLGRPRACLWSGARGLRQQAAAAEVKLVGRLPPRGKAEATARAKGSQTQRLAQRAIRKRASHYPLYKKRGKRARCTAPGRAFTRPARRLTRPERRPARQATAPQRSSKPKQVSSNSIVIGPFFRCFGGRGPETVYFTRVPGHGTGGDLRSGGDHRVVAWECC